MISGEIWSRLAMRSATSARNSAGREASSAAACEGLRWERISAMVCGCSLWMNLASCCGSAFCKASKLAMSRARCVGHQPVQQLISVLGPEGIDQDLPRVVDAAFQHVVPRHDIW